MADAKSVTKKIKDDDIKFVDLRFTDPRGKMQHVTMDSKLMDEEAFADGIMFDGSSIAGWKVINESDMKLMPDPDSAVIDPFFAQSTLAVFCDVLEPLTNEPYERDPRSIAGKAQAYLKQTGVGDTAVFGPGGRVLRVRRRPLRRRRRSIAATRSTRSSCRPTPTPNMRWAISATGRAPRAAISRCRRSNSAQDLRSEMLSVMADMGVVTEKHHHEVGAAQHELGIKFGPLVQTADAMQIYKYVIHQVAQAYGKTATFMPKPVFGDNGSGMHTHQSIWKGSTPVFAGDKYADLSDTALHYIAGILKHAKALNAFTNPTTNSYKRLVPGYEAPVLLAYSSRNRSASCRIPLGSGPKAKRVEVRFPDPAANPYLAFAAMLMAGLDGIENKLNPGDPIDKNLYDLPPEELEKVPTVCGSLRQACEELDKDRAFLKKGNVFTDDAIDAYLELKMEEVERFEMFPHPIEFDMYYSV